MSIWNEAGDFIESGKWTHWPNPFNSVKNITVLMCNDGVWLASIELYAELVASFFWTNFVPSPVEIFRKTFLGGYRCGFYLKIRGFSPGDLIWGGRTTRVLAEIAHPGLVGLFYWWLASTAIAALDAWTSVVYAEESCGLTLGDCLAGSGAGFLIVEGDGSSTGFDVIYDPSNLFNGIGSFIAIDEPGYRAFATMTVTNASAVDLTYRAYISNVSDGGPDGEIMTLAPGESRDHLIMGNVDPGLHTLQARCELFTDPINPGRLRWVCSRFGATKRPVG